MVILSIRSAYMLHWITNVHHSMPLEQCEAELVLKIKQLANTLYNSKYNALMKIFSNHPFFTLYCFALILLIGRYCHVVLRLVYIAKCLRIKCQYILFLNDNRSLSSSSDHIPLLQLYIVLITGFSWPYFIPGFDNDVTGSYDPAVQSIAVVKLNPYPRGIHTRDHLFTREVTFNTEISITVCSAWKKTPLNMHPCVNYVHYLFE